MKSACIIKKGHICKIHVTHDKDPLPLIHDTENLENKLNISCHCILSITCYFPAW